MEDIKTKVYKFESTFYLIISCNTNMFLTKFNVNISSKSAYLLNREIINVKENYNQYMAVKELNNSFRDKNIYIYKLVIAHKNDIEEVSIKLNINSYKLISKNSFKINKASPYRFIYYLEFKADGFFNKELFRDSLSNKFVDNEFNLSNFQKFLIFKEYINNHEKKDIIEYLLEDTAKKINENQYSIDYEMILLFFINLLNFQNEYANIDERRQSLFKLSISKFINIK